jgi:hypothetical protein
VHAFEPLEAHCTSFTDSTRSLAGITLHRLALGAASASLEMKVLDRSDASSLLTMTRECTDHYGLHNKRTEAVQVERLDDVMRLQSMPLPISSSSIFKVTNWKRYAAPKRPCDKLKP